jgi:hypothetical protein
MMLTTLSLLTLGACAGFRLRVEADFAEAKVSGELAPKAATSCLG